MATEQNADQVRDQFLASFPRGTGELAHELWRSLAHVHLTWKDYRSLFGASADRIELLNRVAPTFFGLLDGILRHDVVLAIARLTDPARSVGHDNASLEKLVALLAPTAQPQRLAEWRAKLASLQAYSEPLRSLRNRILAHDDLATALRYHPEPVPGISRAYLEGALERLRDVLGCIEETYRGCRTAHEHIISNRGAEALILALEGGRDHEKCREIEFNRKWGRSTQ